MGAQELPIPNPQELLELRKFCVEQAIKVAVAGFNQPHTYVNVIEVSKDIEAHILGTNDAEILRAARDLAEKVRG